ncbi:MAG: hypothetical protein HZB71_12490 [Betaproteobacteria bacterium]|nr:hypothetical protein [Betaproteobacteria bacterium]
MTADERRLLKAFRALPEAQRTGLMDYAEYLISRQVPEQAIPTQPLPIPRPEKENVVKAIQRLRETYPMVDRARILNEVSVFMTQHLVHGKPAKDVIDELEAFFRRQYEATLSPQ